MIKVNDNNPPLGKFNEKKSYNIGINSTPIKPIYIAIFTDILCIVIGRDWVAKIHRPNKPMIIQIAVGST